MGQVHPVGGIRKPAGFPAEVGGIPSKQTDEPEGQKPRVHGLDQAVQQMRREGEQGGGYKDQESCGQQKFPAGALAGVHSLLSKNRCPEPKKTTVVGDHMGREQKPHPKVCP